MKRNALWILSIVTISLITMPSVNYAADYEIVMVKRSIVVKKELANKFVVIAEGKVKNVGKKAVKNVLIAVECDDCMNGQSKWQKYRSEYKIDYLGSGDKEDFEFDIAVRYSFHNTVFPPDPVGLDIKIISFDEI